MTLDQRVTNICRLRAFNHLRRGRSAWRRGLLLSAREATYDAKISFLAARDRDRAASCEVILNHLWRMTVA